MKGQGTEGSFAIRDSFPVKQLNLKQKILRELVFCFFFFDCEVAGIWQTGGCYLIPVFDNGRGNQRGN